MEVLNALASIVTLYGVVKYSYRWIRKRSASEPIEEEPELTAQDFLLSWPEAGSDAEHDMLVNEDINRRRRY